MSSNCYDQQEDESTETSNESWHQDQAKRRAAGRMAKGKVLQESQGGGKSTQAGKCDRDRAHFHSRCGFGAPGVSFIVDLALSFPLFHQFPSTVDAKRYRESSERVQYTGSRIRKQNLVVSGYNINGGGKGGKDCEKRRRDGRGGRGRGEGTRSDEGGSAKRWKSRRGTGGSECDRVCVKGVGSRRAKVRRG